MPVGPSRSSRVQPSPESRISPSPDDSSHVPHGTSAGQRASAAGSDLREMIREVILEASEIQTRGIKREFQAQREQTDAQFREQREQTDAQFREQREHFDARFEQIDARFEQVDARFERVDARYEQVDAQLKDLAGAQTVHFERYDTNLKALTENTRASHLWNRIHPVLIYDELVGQNRRPENFPASVGEFWRLKQRRGWRQLVQLHTFYGTSSWDQWGVRSFEMNSDDEEEEELAPLHESLMEAVEFAPEIALQTLASYLGLDYDKIALHVEEDMRSIESRSARRKRSVIPEASAPRPKRLNKLGSRKSSDLKQAEPKQAEPEQSTPVKASFELEGKRGLTLSELIGYVPEESPVAHRSNTPSARIVWDPPSDRSKRKDPTESPTSVATSLKDLS